MLVKNPRIKITSMGRTIKGKLSAREGVRFLVMTANGSTILLAAGGGGTAVKGYWEGRRRRGRRGELTRMPRAR